MKDPETERDGRGGGTPGGQSSFRRPLVLLGILLAVFLAFRILLAVLYSARWPPLSLGDILSIFLSGERFDLSAICQVFGVPLLCLSLPFAFARRRGWQRFWGWTVFAAFLPVLLLLAGDTIYYGYGGGHLAQEVTNLASDFDQTLALVLRKYWAALLGVILAFYLLSRLFRRLLVAPVRPPGSRVAATVLAAAFGTCLFVGARGGLGEDRLIPAQAAEAAPPGAKDLVLNGPINALHYLLRYGLIRVDFYPWPEALAGVRSQLLDPDEETLSEDYPLLRARRPDAKPAVTVPGGRPNVVVVMLEGWGTMVVDGYRRDLELPPLGLTPCFDALSGEGRRFTRFFASGRRTRNGYSAFLTSMPSLPGLPYIGLGLEDTPLTWLGRLAAAGGYETQFLVATARDSQDAARLAKVGGFQSVVGAEDLPGEKPTVMDGRAWDAALWQEALRRFSSAEEPFLGFLYTASTHAPYLWKSPEFDRYPADSEDHAYWNSIAGADDALGEFFERARGEPWFRRTVFLLASDHTQRKVSGPLDPPDFFHVPCVLLGPGIQPGPDARVGSQVDILPTVADIAGFTAPHAGLGRSLLDDSAGPDRGAVCYGSEEVIRIEDAGWVSHNLRRRIEGRATRPGADLDAIERRLLQFVQVATLLWVKKKIAPRRD